MFFLSIFLSCAFFPGAANVKQQLSAVQQESEEEQQAFRREVMKLREQLLQVNQERGGRTGDQESPESPAYLGKRSER